MINRLVELSLGGIDADLAEQRVHTEGAGFVGNDRDDPFADVLVTRQAAQQTSEAHGGRHCLAVGTRPHLCEGRRIRQRHRLADTRCALGHETVEGTPTLHHVLVLDGVGTELDVRRVLVVDELLGDLILEMQTVTHVQQLLLGHFLDLVRRVASLEALAQRPTLDGFGQDDSGAAGAEVVRRSFVGGVQLAIVVATTRQVADVVVGEVRDHLAQPVVRAKEVIAGIAARLGCVSLKLAVDGGVHLVEQHTVFVLREQVVPLGTPHDLDDVPAGATEGGLELLDDLAIAAHRAVEALQVAVDDEHQVVEMLTRCKGDGAERFGFVALAITEERPHATARRVVDLAVEQVAVVAGLIERRQRAKAHRHGGELPEVRHETRVRVRAEAATAASEFAAEVVEIVFAQAAFEKGAGIHPGCSVALEVHVVTWVAVVLAAKEVVEANLVEGS